MSVWSVCPGGLRGGGGGDGNVCGKISGVGKIRKG